MIPKKGVIALVIIAVVLAGVAIGMSISDSNDVSLNSDRVTGNVISSGGGEVKIKVEPGQVEDKGPGAGSG